MGIAVRRTCAQTDPLQKIAHYRRTAGGGSDAGNLKWLGNRLTDGKAPIQRGNRILKDHLHLAAMWPQVPL